MPWRVRRQILILGIVFGFFVILAVIVLWAILSSQQPTCFDEKMNGDERGVDCGGSCEMFCQSDMRSLITLWSRTAPVTSDVHHAVAYIENQNINAGIRNIDYQFRVYDSENVLIDESLGSTFIEPNGRIPIFASGIQVGNKIPAYVFFDILSEELVWERTDEEFATQIVRIDRIEQDRMNTRPLVSARITNPQLYNLHDIEVVALLYDESGNLIASSKTAVDRLRAGEREDLIFTWPQTLTAPVARVDIVPRINPFAQDINF